MHAGGGAADSLAHDLNASTTNAHVSTFSTSSQDVLPYAYPDEVEKIRREQERLMAEEQAAAAAAAAAAAGAREADDGTPQLSSDAFEADVRVNGKESTRNE